MARLEDGLLSTIPRNSEQHSGASRPLVNTSLTAGIELARLDRCRSGFAGPLLPPGSAGHSAPVPGEPCLGSRGVAAAAVGRRDNQLAIGGGKAHIALCDGSAAGLELVSPKGGWNFPLKSLCGLSPRTQCRSGP